MHCWEIESNRGNVIEICNTRLESFKALKFVCKIVSISFFYELKDLKGTLGNLL